MPKRDQISNKGTFGKVLNFCGSHNYIGAAYLSAVSSLKVGAGYSALASVDDVIKSVSVLLPDAVFYSRQEGLNRIENHSVILIGCGLGTDKSDVEFFKEVLKRLENKTMPIVIDADGLNILVKLDINKLPENAIITPHPAEASRLLGVGIETVLSDIKGHAQKLSEKYGCITVLKTHRTVVCDKSYNIYINEHGNSALAKAGTGDVLAGIIAGLLAQKVSPRDAAKLGVYIHSRTGEIASAELTEYSVLATDLIKYIPAAIRELS